MDAAHEIGHVLGLDHVAGSDRLMTARSTESIASTVPEIAAGEVTNANGQPFNKV